MMRQPISFILLQEQSTWKNAHSPLGAIDLTFGVEQIQDRMPKWSHSITCQNKITSHSGEQPK